MHLRFGTKLYLVIRKQFKMIQIKDYAKQSVLILLISSISFLLAGQKKTVYIEGLDYLQYSVKNFTVSPNTQIELTMKTVSNLPKSQMAHNWILLNKDADAEKFVNSSIQQKGNDYVDPKMKDLIIAMTGMLGGGEKETIIFTAPSQKGDYTYVCTFPGHFEAGMKGTMTVE
jgi:azurin